jgi:Bacterial PH domain
MSKVESVHVNQSMAGRIFDYGDIVIRGVGSSFEPLRTISRPLEFRNFVAAG